MSDIVMEKVMLPGKTEVCLYSKADSIPGKTLLFFHGGDFSQGPSEEDETLCRRLAQETDALVYAINYRLTPQNTYPSGTLEALEVWKLLLSEEKVRPEETVFLGREAGGNLALSLALWCRDHGIPLPAALALESPVVGNRRTPAVVDPYRGRLSLYFLSADDDDPCAYPVLADYFQMPPVALWGTSDAVFLQILREQGRKTECFPERMTEECSGSLMAFIRRIIH